MERADLKKYDLPDSPGVYLFTQGKGRAKKVLYVGKATSLKDRVRSYFDVELIATRGPRIVDMVTKSDGLMFEAVPTVLEALVREAAFIREYDPPANALGKDDKSFLYVGITKEDIPRVIMVRGKDVDLITNTQTIAPYTPFSAVYGPFPSGSQLKEALRLIRRMFPFFDTPKPVLSGGKHQDAHIEFNRQIAQYPQDMDTKTYLRSIRNVSLFLGGKVQALRTLLTKEMHQYAKEERFEEAGAVRKQLFSLDHIQDVSLIREDAERRSDVGVRIEAYDTAHISGTNAIGVMVVVEDGIAQKKEYRTFKIKGIFRKPEEKKFALAVARQNDDIASLKEILTRRLGHNEWPLPKAFIIDGGKTHKKAAEEILTEAGVGIPVLAVVKDEKHRPREVLGGARTGVTDADAVFANSEAHRFSLSAHKKARSRAMRIV